MKTNNMKTLTANLLLAEVEKDMAGEAYRIALVAHGIALQAKFRNGYKGESVETPERLVMIEALRAFHSAGDKIIALRAALFEAEQAEIYRTLNQATWWQD